MISRQKIIFFPILGGGAPAPPPPPPPGSAPAQIYRQYMYIVEKYKNNLYEL